MREDDLLRREWDESKLMVKLSSQAIERIGGSTSHRDGRSSRRWGMDRWQSGG